MRRFSGVGFGSKRHLNDRNIAKCKIYIDVTAFAFNIIDIVTNIIVCTIIDIIVYVIICIITYIIVCTIIDIIIDIILAIDRIAVDIELPIGQ